MTSAARGRDGISHTMANAPPSPTNSVLAVAESAEPRELLMVSPLLPTQRPFPSTPSAAKTLGPPDGADLRRNDVSLCRSRSRFAIIRCVLMSPSPPPAAERGDIVPEELRKQLREEHRRLPEEAGAAGCAALRDGGPPLGCAQISRDATQHAHGSRQKGRHREECRGADEAPGRGERAGLLPEAP
eukprot:scaffold146_cov265-Pinguiococcus_pyrenoidosus.AAC.14